MRTVGYVITGGKPLHKSHVAFIKAKRKKKVELPRAQEIIFCFIFSLRVRGQHTKTTGRKGRTVGVAKKKN